MEPNSTEGAGGSSKPPTRSNDTKLHEVASLGIEDQNLTKENHGYTDAFPSTSKSINSDGFNPEPSTSSKKTEMEKLLEEMSPRTNKERHKEESNTEGSNTNEDKGSNFFSFYEGLNSRGQHFQYTEAPKKDYANSDEYFADLRQWLQHAYFWQSVTYAFPYFMMCQQFGQMSIQQTSNTSTGTSGVNSNPPFPFPFQIPGFPYQRPEQQRVNRADVIDGVECKIPSFWKRIVAEFIDFLILFVVKIAVTYVAVDFLHFVDVDTFDIFQKDTKMAYKTFLQITQDIVILEMIHRLVVCAFETFWLSGGYNGRIGGSTPGKNIMGLRVIMCDSSTSLNDRNERVVVKPGTNLGLGTSLLRALTKNFVLALLIPTSFAFIFFPHNRTGYDMICNTIVVEEPIIPHRVHRD